MEGGPGRIKNRKPCRPPPGNVLLTGGGGETFYRQVRDFAGRGTADANVCVNDICKIFVLKLVNMG